MAGWLFSYSVWSAIHVCIWSFAGRTPGTVIKHELSRLLLTHKSYRTFNEFKVTLESWNQRDDVTHLVHYRSTEERLRTLLRRSIKVIIKNNTRVGMRVWSQRHIYQQSTCHHHPCDDARQLEKVLAFDVIAIYVRLVTIVNNCASDDYRMLLALRNDDAQAILNLMQTVGFFSRLFMDATYYAYIRP